MGFLVTFVKNDEVSPSITCQIILEWREERNRHNSWREQLVICSSAFWKKKMRELEKHYPNIFQVSIHTGLLCLWPEALIDTFIAVGW